MRPRIERLSVGSDYSRSAPARLPVPERRLIRAAHPNLLLAGDHSALAAAIEELRSSFRSPVTLWCPGDAFVLPSTDSPGTLVLSGVDRLKPFEQLWLLEWLQPDAHAVQVVATTSVPLLPLVATGAFLDALYYRLNVVYLDLAA